MNTSRRKFMRLGAGTAAVLAGIPSCTSGGGKKKRIVVGSFTHETNTFNPNKSTREMFEKSARFGNDVLQRGGGMVHGTYGDCIGGFLDIADMYDVELVGSIRAGAGQGMVTAEAFDFVTRALLDTLDKYPCDAVYIHMHGAGVSEDHPDLEGSTLEIIRRKVGPGIPVVFTMDLHAAVTELMAQMGDAVSIYRTYPHIDAFECGQEIASILLGALYGKIKPVMAVRKIPLMIGPPLNVVTSDMPIKKVYDRAKEIQRNEPGVLTVCPAHGFMQQDCPNQGAGVMVTTDNDHGLARKFADEVGELFFSFRKDYWIDLPHPAETIKLAMRADKPVAIADGGDNIGAGTPGDGTALLAEILKQGVDSALIQIWDPESAKKGAEAGAGATVTLDIGGKSDPIYGPPVRITGKIAAVSDYSGKDEPAIRLDIKGITIVINSDRIGPNDQSNLKAIGINPAKYRMTVCKGGFAFRPQYPESIYKHILSNTPGYSSVDLSTFKYTKIKRPIYPLDEI